jgi:hypothetical protein
MPNSTLQQIEQDPLALAVAHVLTLANEAALSDGVDLDDSLVTISQEMSPSGPTWRVHYGPRDYVGRRGGDLVVLVDERLGHVARVLHGQ